MMWPIKLFLDNFAPKSNWLCFSMSMSDKKIYLNIRFHKVNNPSLLRGSVLKLKTIILM